MDNKLMENYFATRHTVRTYDPDRPVDPALIEHLMELAAHAPNTGNMQLYTAILTTDPDAIAAMAPAHFSQPAITGAKAVLTFCLDLHRYHSWCVSRGADEGMGNLQGYTWAVMDTAIVAQQFVTLAELAGLGTCYLGTTTYNAPELGRLLGLPRGVVPLLTVTLGYPAGTPEVTDRLDTPAVLHRERYNVPGPGDIDRIYAFKESMESNRRYVADNGKENLAQLFAQVRYPRQANEHFSTVFKEYLKNQGIDL